VIKIGKIPVQIGVALQYYAQSPGARGACAYR